MTRRRVVVAVLASALLPAVLCAQGGGAGTPAGVTLRAAVDSALRNNPDLRIARSAADSARSEVRIARALPNPTFSVVPGSPTQYSGTIPIDVGPQRAFRGRASDLGARAVESDLRDATRKIVLAARRAFYDVLLADARRNIVAGRREVMRQIVAADSARVRAGDLPERALTRSEVELVRTESDAARAGVDAQTTRLALQAVMGATAPDTALRIEGDMRFRETASDASDALRTAMANRPDVAASRDRELQSGALQRLATSAMIPVPQLSYVRQFSAPFESGRYFALGLGLELPLLNQYRGERDRAAAGRIAASMARQRVETQVTTEVRSALAELGAQRALVRRYEGGVIEKVQQNVDATRYAYTRGATSLLDVLDALRAQQDVLTDYNTALHDYWIAVYSVEAAEGVTQN